MNRTEMDAYPGMEDFHLEIENKHFQFQMRQYTICCPNLFLNALESHFRCPSFMRWPTFFLNPDHVSRPIHVRYCFTMSISNPTFVSIEVFLHRLLHLLNSLRFSNLSSGFSTSGVFISRSRIQNRVVVPLLGLQLEACLHF